MDEKIEIDAEKQVIKFRRKPAKTGRNYCFFIPISYIRNGLVDPDKEYTIYLSPADNDSDDSS
ncbi:MAG: hypothetical protein GF353_28765 [Candidatus Lokiarchaeota archaeon]|nr:hypothetical protein [Candidatus Lokiarchaeota archaeon]MBD3353995.1 hypothetical protein [Candidatus Lokiarchaeota archaeon]